jgi:hypothetical protein
MNAPDPANTGALDSFTDGVAERVTGDDPGPFLIFGPRWAQEGEGAGPPPEGLSNPVWSREAGWAEKEEATRKFDGDPLVLNAPKDDGTGQ